MEKRVKSREIVIVVFFAILLIIPLISAGFFQNTWNKITGKASTTSTVLVNISVNAGVPTIYNISNVSSAITLTDAPSPTYITINFSVNAPNGVATLNNATAAINLTKAGQELIRNGSCAVKDWSGNSANYTCNLTIWWWNNPGTWTVYANISDLGSNYAVTNGSHTVTVNSLTGFVMSPAALTFSSLTAGSINQTPTNYLLLNNTGNTNVTAGNVQINATDLVGETDKSKFLWASNFSASTLTGGNIECNITGSATSMINMTFTGVANTIIPVGNYTKSDGTGQETMYLCLRKVGYELTQQQYSTNQYGSWTVKIV
jgi:hypothetical protein